MAKLKHDPARLQHAFANLIPKSENSKILDLGWGGDAFVHLCHSNDVHISFLGDDVRSVRFCSDQHINAIHASTPREITDVFDTVIYHPAGHSAKGQVFEWVEAAHERLRLGGVFLIAGQKDRGVLSYIKYVEHVFGQVKRVGREGKMQFFQAQKLKPVSAQKPHDTTHVVELLDFGNRPFEFATNDGVFSRDGIDIGSRLLLDQVTLLEDAGVLDIGCGYGLLGIVCGHLAPRGQVLLTDVSARAVQCTQENILKNKLPNAKVAVGDLYEAAQGKKFDLIISNPPFHEGNKTGWPLIDGAWEHLNTGGELLLVVMRPIPYQKRMERVFGSVDICAESSGYTVLRAVKKRK